MADPVPGSAAVHDGAEPHSHIPPGRNDGHLGWTMEQHVSTKQTEPHRCALPSRRDIRRQDMGAGTVVRCDCGQHYMLVRHGYGISVGWVKARHEENGSYSARGRLV